jgi:hypothetical protein
VQELRQQPHRHHVALAQRRHGPVADGAEHPGRDAARSEQRHPDVGPDLQLRRAVEQDRLGHLPGARDERREAAVEHPRAQGPAQGHGGALGRCPGARGGVDEAQDLVGADELAHPGDLHAELRADHREQPVHRVGEAGAGGELPQCAEIPGQTGGEGGRIEGLVAHVLLRIWAPARSRVRGPVDGSPSTGPVRPDAPISS